MAGFVRLISPIDFSKLLCSRNNLLNIYQNASTKSLNSVHEITLPSKPKKPQTAFLLYLNNVRQKLLNENPNMKSSQVVKKASEAWTELDPMQKEDFRRQYNERYKVYVKELQEFENSLTDEQKQLLKEEGKSKYNSRSINDELQKKKTLGKPKRPLTSFLSYILSKRHEKDPNMSYKSWVKTLSTNWKNMSDAEKDPYITQSVESMLQYRKDLTEWEEKMINLGHVDIVRQQTLTKSKNIEKEK